MNEEELVQAWDDVSGSQLGPEMVRKARQEEFEAFRKHQVYEKVPISECMQRTGKKPSCSTERRAAAAGPFPTLASPARC